MRKTCPNPVIYKCIKIRFFQKSTLSLNHLQVKILVISSKFILYQNLPKKNFTNSAIITFSQYYDVTISADLFSDSVDLSILHDRRL